MPSMPSFAGENNAEPEGEEVADAETETETPEEGEDGEKKY